MSSVRQSLRVPLLWCDASKLGDFVDFLYSLIEPDLDGASEYTQERAVPRWDIRTPQRRITAYGAWRDISDDAPWSKSRSISIRFGSSHTSFDLTASWTGVELEVDAGSSKWLDDNLPLIRANLRRLSPRWTFVLWRHVFTALATAGFFGLLTARNVNESWFVWVALALFLIGAGGCFLPTVRLGPQPQPVWLRVVVWLAAAFIVAGIGALVQRFLLPS